MLSQSEISRHRNYVFLIIGIVFLAYANSLSNGFVGDDHVLFGNNTFYKSLQSLPRLIQKNFITSFSDIDASSSESVSVSGCVSYRPVTALSFFADFLLWKSNPFGYHLTNVLLHIFVSVLMYYFVFLITRNAPAAVLSALLFATHPINAEAVNSIGYRSDLLALLFFLASLIFFVKYRNSKSNLSKNWLLGSFAAFFMALFSKESAVTLPFLLALYDFYFFPLKDSKYRARRIFEYSGFIILLLFYLWVYFFVFPNTSNPPAGFVYQNIPAWFTVVAKIFYSHLVVLFLPFKITVLPTLYLPSSTGIKAYELVSMMVFLSLCVAVTIRSLKTSRAISFFTFWFFITYLPVSNIIPLPNPFAFRFMYMPSLGFFVVLGILLEQLAMRVSWRFASLNPGEILKFGLIGIYVAVTVPHNTCFKNDLVLCREMIKNYPQSAKPYWVLGEIYLGGRNYEKAIENFRKYLSMNQGNPSISGAREDYFIHNRLGMCYVDDPEAAIAEFETAVRLRPDYAQGYTNLAKAYILKNDCSKALAYALKAIQLKNNLVIGYVYAIHCYAENKEWRQAKGLLMRALTLSPDDENLKYLQNIIEK